MAPKINDSIVKYSQKNETPAENKIKEKKIVQVSKVMDIVQLKLFSESS